MGATEYNQKQIDSGKLTGAMIAFLGGDTLVEKVKRYQRKKNLLPDGYCGPITQAAILADMAREEDSEIEIPEGKMTAEEIQEGLRLLGYAVEVDGNLRSSDCKSRIKDYQKDCRLTRDGIWGNQSETKLKGLLELLKKYGPDEGFRHCLRWHNTYYYVTEEASYKRVNLVPVKDPKGRTIAQVPASFFSSMALEGTGKLRDGKILNVATGPSYHPCDPAIFAPVFNYAKRMGWIPKKPGYAGIRTDGTKATQSRNFHEVKLGPKGYPIERKGIELDPYRTLATDTGKLSRHDKKYKGKGGVVPSGTRVFVLEFAGQELPDGTIHDGWFQANDTGGGIFGAHFDVFTGSRKWAKAFKPWPSRAHVWFEGSEDKLGLDYTYGLH